MFGVFDSKLKSSFGLSQTESVLVETSVQVGLYCGLTQGLFYDRFGVGPASLLAAALLGIGYGGAFLASVYRLSAGLLAVCFFLIGQGSHGFYTAATMTNVPNFEPAHQGTVMGLLAGSFGLSGAVFAAAEARLDTAESTTLSSTCADANASLAEPNATTPPSPAAHHPMYFFLLCSVLLVCVGSIAALVLRRVPRGQLWQALPTADSSLPLEPLALASTHSVSRGSSPVPFEACASSGHATEETSFPSSHSQASSGEDVSTCDTAALLGQAADDTSIHQQHSSILHTSTPAAATRSRMGGERDGASGSVGAVDVTGRALLGLPAFWLLWFAMAIDDGCGSACLCASLMPSRFLLFLVLTRVFFLLGSLYLPVYPMLFLSDFLSGFFFCLSQTLVMLIATVPLSCFSMHCSPCARPRAAAGSHSHHS